jgi:hypothetical protein
MPGGIRPAAPRGCLNFTATGLKTGLSGDKYFTVLNFTATGLKTGLSGDKYFTGLNFLSAVVNRASSPSLRHAWS